MGYIHVGLLALTIKHTISFFCILAQQKKEKIVVTDDGDDDDDDDDVGNVKY